MKKSFAYTANDVMHRIVLELGNAKSSQIDADICERKHGGNPESQEAHKTIRAGLQARRERVYETIKSHSHRGLTVDELAVMFDTNPNSISGRVSELWRDSRIIKTNSRRKTRSGCSAAVWKAI